MKFTKYLWAYYPEESFDVQSYRAKEGHKGSAQDHFYVNAPGGNCLTSRNSWCGCRICLNSTTLWSTKCRWRQQVGRVKHHQLQQAIPNSARPRPLRLHSMSFEEFCTQLYNRDSPAAYRVVVVRRHKDDVDPDPAPYYLVRVISDP